MRPTAIAAFVLLHGCAGSTTASLDAPQVQVHEVVLDRAPRLPRTVDVVRSLELRSPDARFGGFSGLALQGDRLRLISDRGYLWEARVEADREGIREFEDWAVTELDTRNPLDFEALRVTPDGELLLLSERRNALFTLREGFLRASATLPGSTGSGANRGPEAMAILDAGTILVIAEKVEGGRSPGVLLDGASTEPFAYRPETGFAATDAVAVDGDLLVLERRASVIGGWEARVVYVADVVPSIARGVLEGQALLRVADEGIVDNYEGLDAWMSDGRLELLLVSDDNFSALQRTLLLQLRLAPWPPAPR